MKITMNIRSVSRFLRHVLPAALLSASLCQAVAQTDSVAVSTPRLRTLSGCVTDAETGEPIDFVSVFFSGTTRGMVTDEDGCFEIRLPGDGTYDLVAAHLDYVTESRTLQVGALTDSIVNFRLKHKLFQINEVVVREKRRIGNGFRNMFWMRFFGVTALKDKVIKAENPKVVHFSYNTDSRILRAAADEPIEVINNYLGYRIFYSLSEFAYNYRSMVTTLRGYPRFEPLQPADEAQAETWRNNRLDAYHNSMMHFTRSLYTGTMPRENFIAQSIVRPDDEQPADGNDRAFPLPYALRVLLKPDLGRNVLLYGKAGQRIAEQRYNAKTLHRADKILLSKPLPLRALISSNDREAPEKAKTLNTENSLMISELIKKKEGKRKERTDTTTLFTLHFKKNLIYFYPDGSYYPPTDIVKEAYERYGILYLLPWDYTPGD